MHSWPKCDVWQIWAAEWWLIAPASRDGPLHGPNVFSVEPALRLEVGVDPGPRFNRMAAWRCAECG